MKRLILCVVILFLCFLMSFLCFKYLETNCLKINDALTACAEEITNGEYENALKLLDNTEKSFETQTKIFGMIVGDEIIELLHYKIPSIKYHVKDRNIEKALESIRECQSTLEEIPKGEKVSIDNIF